MNKFIEFYLLVAASHPVIFLTLIFGPILFSAMLFTKHPWSVSATWVVIIYLIIKSNRTKKDRRKIELEKINKEHNANFIGNFGHPVGLYYDQSKRLFMFYDERNDECIRVEPFELIREWQLNWKETTRNNKIFYSDVYMRINTNDIHTPVINLELNSKANGEKLDSTLGILLST